MNKIESFVYNKVKNNYVIKNLVRNANHEALGFMAHGTGTYYCSQTGKSSGCSRYSIYRVFR